MKSPVVVSLILAAVCAIPTVAQSTPPALWEAGAGYNFTHTNAPPSGCGCFSMNGGTASVARRLGSSFSLVGEIGGTVNSNINATGRSLTLLTYLAGPRYRVPTRRHLTPFGEVLLGAAHAGGGLYASSGSTSGSSNSFATSIGGGLDVDLNSHIGVRLVQADYLLTLLPNGVNSRQNNFSLTTGVVFRFGAK